VSVTIVVYILAIGYQVAFKKSDPLTQINRHAVIYLYVDCLN